MPPAVGNSGTVPSDNLSTHSWQQWKSTFRCCKNIETEDKLLPIAIKIMNYLTEKIINLGKLER